MNCQPKSMDLVDFWIPLHQFLGLNYFSTRTRLSFFKYLDLIVTRNLAINRLIRNVHFIAFCSPGASSYNDCNKHSGICPCAFLICSCPQKPCRIMF